MVTGSGSPVASVAEKRRIVELTFEPGASVAFVARANGVNANQVFKWRRALERGELGDPVAASTALLPVTLSAPSVCGRCKQVMRRNSRRRRRDSHRVPGPATISVECGADPVLLRSILESLRK